MTTVFIFPGQGAQAVGMGKALAEAFSPAREVFEEVDEALRQNLSRLIFEGPEADLTLTENAQPALMAVSLAVVRVLESECGIDLGRAAAYVAGHSLGEISALCAARAIALSDCARLLKRRGQAMQEAVPVGAGAMAALLGLNLDDARGVAEAAAGAGVCDTANDNCEGQVVVSGDKAAVERAVALAKERGARRAMMLSVSAPFHCRLMAPAADAVAAALADMKIAPPRVPIVANVTAEAVSDPETIRRLLVEQVTGLVRWREGVLWMREQGVERLIEVGAGRVLTGLARRIDPALEAIAVGTPEDVEAVAKQL